MGKKELLRRAKTLLSALGCNSRELSILITDDREIKTLNSEYRNKPKATDVLSFALDDGEPFPIANDPSDVEHPLGDLVISMDTAARQAREYGVHLHEELERLLIHGLLHLLGYDHENVSKAEAARMRSKEQQLMRMLAKERAQ